MIAVRPMYRVLLIVFGGIVVYVVVARAAPHFAPVWFLAPGLLLAAIWMVGIWFWIERPAHLVLRYRRLGLCERCGYDPGATSAACAQSAAVRGRQARRSGGSDVGWFNVYHVGALLVVVGLVLIVIDVPLYSAHHRKAHGSELIGILVTAWGLCMIVREWLRRRRELR